MAIRLLCLTLTLLLAALPAQAANRYWVGGTGTWNTSATTHWSATSGGSSGASAPVSTDDVFFDASSGGGTVTVYAGNVDMDGLDTSGWSGIFKATSSASSIRAGFNSGSIVLGSGTTWSVSGGPNLTVFTNSAGSNTLTTNGVTIGPVPSGATAFVIEPSAETLRLQDNVTVSGSMQFNMFYGGTASLNGHDLTAFSVSVASYSGSTVSLGSGTITLTGTGTIWSWSATGGSFSSSSSTIVVSNSTSTTKTFAGSGKSYGAINVSSVGSGGLVFSGNNTFTSITFSPGIKVTFTSGSTTTASTLTWSGASSLQKTQIVASTPGTPATISVPSGIVSEDYLSLKDSTATGGASFYAGAHSTDVSGNTGWIFTAPPTAIDLGRMFQVFE